MKMPEKVENDSPTIIIIVEIIVIVIMEITVIIISIDITIITTANIY